MPIYEYRCEACGHALETIQKFSDAPLTDCPACGKSALKKLLSAAGFQLKGGGWYATDFKGGSKKPEPTGSGGGGDKPQGCGGGTCGGCAHG
jgi:putative FmdB family regulatory protein